MNGMLPDPGILITKNFNTDEPYHGGHPVTILIEIIKCFISVLVEVHFHSPKEFKKIILWDVEFPYGFLELLADGMGGVAGIAALYLLVPEPQFFFCLGWRSSLINDVVRQAAKGVHTCNGLPFFWG
jgi:hypothetical protein